MNDVVESSDLLGQRQQRIDKLNELKKLKVSPYPSTTRRDTEITKINSDFESYNGKNVIVAGRVKNIRSHGKLKFMDLMDDSGKIQIYIRFDGLSVTELKETRSLSFEELDLLDVSDFIEVSGEVTKTQRGEESVLAKEIVLLTKVLRPTPTSLEDKEERFRRRYVDMNVNVEVKERMKRRAQFWNAHREFFNQANFHEVSIPVLEHIPGGGDAVPFITHMNAINEDFFLRISHELPLKRLIGGGFEKVYDIGARFRNEGLSDEHLPEHVAMEFYWAYANWKDGMKLIQDLFRYVIDKVYGGQMVFQVREFTVDFSKDWEIIDFNEIFQKEYGVKDIYTITIEEVKELLTKHNISFERSINIPRGVDALWKKLRKNIGGPAFLINHPKYLSPLQKASVDNPNMVERFQPIIAGSELGNGWSEVNDAIDQYERFMEQQKLRDSGDDEAQWLDIDYVEMLEYGMPPTFGYGHSERVFWFLENVTAREGVPFPQLKFSYEDITRKVYPELNFDELEANRTKVDKK
jgi:lysyl-tRNA synthetase class 2